jgi:hypothetical protein
MGADAIVEPEVMKSRAFESAVCAVAIAALAAPSRAQNSTLHPPAALVQSLGKLRDIDSLDELPSPIRRGVFALPGATQSSGWALAAPGAAWNATDAIVDPSLPGRRMIFAGCVATVCVLHYERGGIAHIFLVMALERRGDGWKVVWLAYGHPAAKNMDALKALLQNHSLLNYYDDTNPSIDY